MLNLLRTVLQYLIKGGLLSISAYGLRNLRTYITSTMVRLAVQMVILGFLLFVIDWVLPRIIPGLFPKGRMEAEAPATEIQIPDIIKALQRAIGTTGTTPVTPAEEPEGFVGWSRKDGY